jgi:4-hydroxyphenylpyruvate dioxygenase
MNPPTVPDREAFGTPPNPLGLLGIEFIEYSTSRPQALGHVLEHLGFVPVARHRSREVLLYRQGDIHVIVNAHQAAPNAEPVIAAVALRVQDAASAYRRVLDLGAWAVPTQVEVMELNIPAIHGVGSSRLYFVDRHREFSIYDVDFIAIPGVDPQPPALNGLHLFGLVQYIGLDRTADWTAFYGALLGFAELPAGRDFGVLTSGVILASPCGTFFWQLIEPDPDLAGFDHDESLQRVAFGCRDVPATVAMLRGRGVEFVESAHGVRTSERGALTRPQLGGVVFELVHDPR